jgi:E3 ubiquitin-protein ligase synoviolin
LESGRPAPTNNANANANGNANPGGLNPAGAPNPQGAIALFNRVWNGPGQAPQPAPQPNGIPQAPLGAAAPPHLFAQPPAPFPWAAAAQMNQPLWGQVPQPPRQFQGFNAGGRWHPWGAPPENERDQRQRVDSTPTGPGGLTTPGGASSISGSGLVTSPAPIDNDTTPMQLSHPISGPAPPVPTPVQKTVPVPNKTPPEAKAGAGSSTAAGGSGSMGNTPREAAALAALRRFQAGRSTESLMSPSTPGAKAAPASSPGTPTAVGSGGIPDLSNTRLSQSVSSGPAASVHRSASLAREHAPTLIPLYNPAPSPPAAGSSMTSPSPYFAGAANTSTTPLIDPRPALPRSPAGFTFGQSSLGTPASFTQSQAQPNLPRHGQLPPNLSEAQLLNLDRVTRETIDERLKVLEGVQRTVWRCVEDLTRLRSVLPNPLDRARRESSSSSAGVPSGSRETSFGSSLGVEIERVAPVPPPEIHVESSAGEIEEEGQGKGKGKAVENGDGSRIGEGSEDVDMR